MRYRIFAIDLDNTLFDASLQVSARNREALLRAEAAGCRVVICTARGRYMTRPALADIGPLSGPHIVFNGAARFRCFDEHPEDLLLLDRATVRQCARAIEAMGVGLSGFEDPRAGDRVYVTQPIPGLRRWSAANPERVVMVDSLEDVIDRDLVVLLCWGNEQQARRVHEAVGCPPGFAAPRVAPALQWDSYLVEVTAAGATKGEALARLARDLDVPREAIIAVGDSDPDIGMIEFAGVGVAVDNAKDHVKAAADTIAPRCDQDAVAHVVEHFILADS